MNAIASLRERIRHSLPGGGPGDRPDLHGDPWREQVLATLLPVAAAAGAVAYVVKLFQVVRDGQWALAGIYTLAYAWILAIAVARRSKPQPLGPTPRPSGPGDRRGPEGVPVEGTRPGTPGSRESEAQRGAKRWALPYAVRAYSLLILMYALAEAALGAIGLRGDPRLWLLSVPVTASLLLGLAGGLWALGLSALVLAAGAGLHMAGALPASLGLLLGPGSLETWLSAVAVFVMVTLLVSVSLAVLTRLQQAGLNKERATIGALEGERAELRQRTRELERRLGQVRSAAGVTRALSGVLDPEALLRQVVHLIHERAELSFVAVYLLEGEGRGEGPFEGPASGARHLYLAASAGKAAEPRAGSRGSDTSGSWENGAEGAGEPLAEAAGANRLPVDETSLAGRAVVRREAHVTRPEGRQSRETSGPEGPATRPNRQAHRSAVALPLLRREQVLGALVVYSRRPDAFDRDDVAVLQGVADGLALALENARLFQELRRSLEEIRALHQQHLAGTWAERSGSGHLSYTFEAGGAPLDSSVQAEVSVPLLLRQQAIGQIRLEASRAGWTPDEMALIEGVAAQAALALENVRLLEETRLRASHERLAAEIAAKVRASTDVDTIVRTAISELSQALNVSTGSIRLGSDQ